MNLSSYCHANTVCTVVGVWGVRLGFDWRSSFWWGRRFLSSGDQRLSQGSFRRSCCWGREIWGWGGQWGLGFGRKEIFLWGWGLWKGKEKIEEEGQ